MDSMTITASSVKDLREKTGAGMMECKKALEENGGDMDKAIKWLREKGIASASKKAGRAAGEGLVGVKVEGASGVILELNCETDFVAKTDNFKNALKGLTEQAFKDAPAGEPKASAEAFLKKPGQGAATVEEQVKALIGSMGENMSLSRVAKIQVSQGLIGSYIHSDGKLAALVAVKTGKADSASKAELVELAKDLAMQVAGHIPPAEAISREQLPADLIAREKEIAVTQARATGKPEAMVEKIAEGKMGKVLQELTLLDQLFIKDPSKKVNDLVKEAAAKAGDTVSVEAFVRVRVGA
jgi:elongation factor Ts